MAETVGLVQRLIIVPGNTTSEACAWIGPSPANMAILIVSRKASDPEHIGSFKNSMIEVLATAMVARREVVATHGPTDAIITSLRIDPA